MKTTNSRLVRNRVALFTPALASSFRQAFQCDDPAVQYIRYLVALHGFVRASVPLMAQAIRVLENNPRSDPLTQPLLDYYTEHIEEERGHDEWLLEDLESVGLQRQQVLAEPPSPHAAAMVGCQYYWILHHHPVALLGYICVLEGTPPTRGFLEDLQARTGHPRAAFRTLAKHGELDPHHIDEFDNLLDELPLPAAEIDIICTSACVTVQHAVRLFQQLHARAATGYQSLEHAPGTSS